MPSGTRLKPVRTRKADIVVRLLFLFGLVVLASGTARANFQDGLAAYDRGDYASALRLWRPLADSGNAAAQWRLALLYRGGVGVAQDNAAALAWNRRAAARGLTVAQYGLGRAYERGDGVRRDLMRAYAWYSMAAARFPAGGNRDRSAARRDRVARRLTPSKLARAQQLVRDWQRSSGRPDPAGHAAVADPAISGRVTAATGPDPTVPLLVRVQRLLRDLGYPAGPADGILGAQTGAAIRGFQMDHGLTVTGQPTPSLEQALRVALAARAGSVASPAARGLASQGPETTRPASPAPVAGSRRLQRSSASGFVVDRRGYVLTNYHVVAGCGRLRIAPDSDARLAAADPDSDLALLQTARQYDAGASFRGGAGIRAGDAVVVAGYPLQGILSSEVAVTTGVVSALAGPGDDRRILQITAPVQPGNSGGPLLDLAGNVVGIVAIKLNALEVARRTGALPQNVNFAINALTARALLDGQGVRYVTKPSSDRLSPADVAEQARAFTVRVECWQ